ncbi:SAV_915 family protein [Streptomyces sp. NBC_01235]|uniref:SAV_915 family protein n=1 Tax=Streptomyces sp. NBC_01235 TaxID=2903788 RepID=UPI002E1401AE|nr:hypothetical protein OG289_36150 [Streptomyces sp. NBC_01235]
MGAPIRSHLLDYIETAPPAGAVPASPSTPEPRRSRLLEYVEYAGAEPVEAAGTESPAPPGPRPGVPAYQTPVFVPAHPRYVDVTDRDGRPARLPFIAYELFDYPAAGTGAVAFAFTTLDRLVAALGESQPWVATSIGPLAEAVAEYDVTVLLDPRVAPGHHNWQPDDLAAYAREVR